MSQQQQSSTSSFTQRLFVKLGVKPIDVPVGLIVFNGLLWPEWIAVFLFSVKRRPLRYWKIHSIRFQRFHASLRTLRIYNTLETHTIKSANKISSYKWFARLGRRLGTSSSDLTYGTIETIIIYNALLPIVWVPLNFAAAVTFINYYRGTLTNGGSDSDSGDGAQGGNNGNDNSNTNTSSMEMHDDNEREYTKDHVYRLPVTEMLFSIRQTW
eukprot:CAMPEP_0202716336 /NCGR_PEP_ID=MMETSP1385-20130828/100441_1 /ASSEMBLY_ACC=CAM_ASM_000861 /TAXON_ID=933848 /ORGANISM="Elphidium margaritaceum" /LENGTH=211 /DNA_ID=CAMNT_0049378037 /DNA_START=40 /DNA_END=672 /DNA_ORIENTATION=+